MKARTLIRLVAGCLALAAMADSCGPTVTIENKTSFEISAIIGNKGTETVLSPSPGESSYAVVQQDAYVVTVIPKDEWLTHAKATRQFLNDQLANPDQLTGPQLLEVVKRLKDIALRMKAFEDAAKGGDASCVGILDDQHSAAVVTVTSLPDGKLKAACK
ncbi:MAG: hypothetical protein ABI847_00455 [Anaerolineales bacterium]